MELADYLRILRNHWIAVTAMVIVAAAVAFGWSSLQPKVYAASSSGFVTSGSGGDPGLDNLNDVLSKSRAASYVVLAKDRETASIVIGHGLAVLMAHELARRSIADNRALVLSQLPLAAAMVAYTLFGLWLLSTPVAG